MNPDQKSVVLVASDHEDENNFEKPVPESDSGSGAPSQNSGVHRGFVNRAQQNRKWPPMNPVQGQWKRESDLHGTSGGGFRGGRQGNPQSHKNQDDRLLERLKALSAPMYDLPPLEITEKKFSGNSRLYVGNIPKDITPQEFTELFQKYGEVGDAFINMERSFAFIKLDFHCNAEKAKRELHGFSFKGRTLKIRYAPKASTIKVKNLTPYVTNELLYVAFSIFGEVERCVIIVDDRGKSTGEGIIIIFIIHLALITTNFNYITVYIKVFMQISSKRLNRKLKVYEKLVYVKTIYRLRKEQTYEHFLIFSK